jgi:hypothetical protein
MRLAARSRIDRRTKRRQNQKRLVGIADSKTASRYIGCLLACLADAAGNHVLNFSWRYFAALEQRINGEAE